MGFVYRAEDLMLNRSVAIKFLKSDSPEKTQKLRKEAQAQARVDHPNICKVYEVAELEGKPYISMQYVGGKGLDVVAGEMLLEEKVAVMRDVAEAAHAAHRTGLIHRDLKPSNILIEGSSADGWVPYVADFGLARDLDSADLTKTGTLVGTPAYMAPEQVRGEVHSLDRRTDVYGLGATLYELLTGCRPFDEPSSIGTMMRILNDEPIPPRSKNPRIPADLEKVVLKCLAKDPGSRYDSARALAEDLSRFLDGEPVLARPVGSISRLLRRARRHRAVAVVLSIASLAALISGVIGFSSRRTALRRAAFAQQFGQDVVKIESLLRYAYMLPLHAAEAERKLVRDRIAKIEASMAAGGRPSEGPGLYAIGRGYLALGDHDKALEHLEAAWETEYRTPETAYALGLATGAVYQRELKLAERIADKEQQEARRRELRSMYGRAALGYLRESQGIETESPHYLDGLIAFYDARSAEAKELAEKAASSAPWMYEAKFLLGDVLAAEGFEKRRKGDYEGALADLAAAEEAILDGIGVGQSDPRGYRALCELRVERVATVHGGAGGEIRPIIDLAISASDQALLADPAMGAAQLAKTRAYAIWLDYELGHGMDPSETLALAEASARRVIELEPRRAEAYAVLGEVHFYHSVHSWLHGRDPIPPIDASIEALARGLELEPGSANTLSLLGNRHLSKGLYLAARGADSRESFLQAIHYDEEAVRLSPRVHSYLDELGIACRLLGRYEMDHGQDPLPSFRRAIEAFERAAGINASNPSIYSNLGNVYANMAAAEAGSGIDMRPRIEKAIQNFRKAIALNPTIPMPHSNCGTAYAQLAEYEQQTGGDPRKNLEIAREHLGETLRINPGWSSALALMGRTYVTEAAYEMKQGLSSGAVARGKTWLLNALAKNPKDADTHRYLGKLELVEARLQMRKTGAPEKYFDRAHAAMKQALEINPNAENHLAIADLLRWKVRWRATLVDVKFGLEMAEGALAVNQRLAAAHAIKGTLLRVQSQLTGNSSLERLSRESIRRAWELNPRLGDDYEAPREAPSP